MIKKYLIFLVIVTCSLATFAQNYANDYKVAIKLFQAKRYNQAMAAFEKLAKTTATPRYKYNYYRYASYSALNLKQYDKAIAFADKIYDIEKPYKYLYINVKLKALYYAKKYKQANELITIEEIITFPKLDLGEGAYYLGLSQHKLGKDKNAYKTFTLGAKKTKSGYNKALLLLGGGNIQKNVFRTPNKAVEIFRTAIKIPKGHSSHKAMAHIAIAQILLSQNKNSEAIAEYNKALALKKLKDYWKARILAHKADTLKLMSKETEAIQDKTRN